MKSGYWMTAKGSTYWGVALVMHGRPVLAISEHLHRMRAKLKRRWAGRNFRPSTS